MADVVMVPVPEQLVDDVHKFLLMAQFRAAGTGWTAELVDTHLRRMPDDARALACTVARRIAAGSTPDDAELSVQFGISKRELFACAQELNEITIEPHPGFFLYALRDDERRVFTMSEACAALVCDWASVHRDHT
jgi:hypothetical protein